MGQLDEKVGCAEWQKLGFSGTVYLKSNLTAIAHTIIVNSWVIKSRTLTWVLRKDNVELQSYIKMFQMCMVSILYHLLLWRGGKMRLTLSYVKCEGWIFLNNKSTQGTETFFPIVTKLVYVYMKLMVHIIDD